MHFLASCTPKFEEFMATQGLRHDGDVIVFDVDKFIIIRTVSNVIVAEYNSENRPHGADSLWDHFGLSGDDDVDYQGGYIAIALEVLTEYDRRSEK